MPEPKPTKRTFEALTDTALDGLQLVQPRSQPQRGAKPAAPKRPSQPAAGETGEPELVHRLIDFIKKI